MKFFPLLCLVFLLFAAAEAVPFTCNATATATCQSLVAYVPQNATTYAAIRSLFQVPLSSLFAANGLPATSPAAARAAAGAAVRVPIRCACAKGTGVSAGGPAYTVRAGDGLDAIARYTFGGLVVFEDIAAASGVPDPNKIEVGQRLVIPLPCSCDPAGRAPAVHLAYVVPAGSTLEGIAAEMGTAEDVIEAVNGIADPKKLKAGQVLDVPLRACSSSISSTSVDHGLLVPNGSYALTANNCISCSCSSLSYQLDCHLTKGLSSSACPADKCNNLFIGNTTTSGCELTTCTYTGFSNSTSFMIHANTTARNTCASTPAALPNPTSTPTAAPANPTSTPSSGSNANRLGLTRANFAGRLTLLHIALLCFSFL